MLHPPAGGRAPRAGVMPPTPSSPTPALLSRHKTHWQRCCRSCQGKLRAARSDWEAARKRGLAALSELSNTLITASAIAEGGDADGDALERIAQSHASLGDLRSAALDALRRDAADQSARVGDALRDAEAALEGFREARDALAREANDPTLTTPAAREACTRLKATQAVFWSAPPRRYLTDVDRVVQTFERELAVKAAVAAFLREAADAFAAPGGPTPPQTAANGAALRDALNVHVVVWMLEPEADDAG